ncbi:nuclear receptor coactivator 5 [Polypterus senegalus]|uniref:nuclear receptor coactivator 5 n=1 Tax=Polypterus senegalus TaxID=55291 RepID=UPI00196554FE|nr:nuclear receptor coactivator 5 [Polypterus senegalus]
MSSWVKVTRNRGPLAGGGNIRPFKPFRMAPYPGRDERKDAFNEDTRNFEEMLSKQYDYSSGAEDHYERYQYSQNAPAKGFTPADRRNSLYQQFYKQIQEEYDRQRPADCVVLSVTKQQTDYAKSLGHCLQDRGLVVEMIYLHSESGLTRALQDVRHDGSPFCILVEHSNVALSSCTVIIFYESLKIHRNMPSERALDFVTSEHRRLHAEHLEKEREEIAMKAADLADDYLEREKSDKYTIPLSIRHLFFLMSEGKHLYLEELNTIAEYVRTRKEEMEATQLNTGNGSYPNVRNQGIGGLNKPPPLLPTPGHPVLQDHPGRSPPGPPGMGDRQSGALLPTPGSFPKSKPPPLLSMHSRAGLGQGPLNPSKKALLGEKPALLPTPGPPSRPGQQRR